MSLHSGVTGAPSQEPDQASSITRRAFLAGGAAFGLGLAAFSATRGRHQLEITQRTFAIADLPDAFLGFRIAQISDIHLKEYTEAWYIEHVVAQTNALNPDLVLLTGDFISRGPLSDSFSWRTAGLCAELLSALKAPQIYAVIGNHEAAVGPSHVTEPLKAKGIRFLIDSYVPIERGFDRFWLCGTNDATLGPDLDAALPRNPRIPVILMCHEPDFIDTILDSTQFAPVDLMLSGHSHGGQVRLPFAGPLILPPMGRKYFDGHYRFGRHQLYVNRGIGTVGLPFRFDCPSEITHITLTRA